MLGRDWVGQRRRLVGSSEEVSRERGARGALGDGDVVCRLDADFGQFLVGKFFDREREHFTDRTGAWLWRVSFVLCMSAD